jgi:hypothetical protein
MDTKSLKIGITMGSKNMALWTNGILLNVLYFVELLKRSKKNYDITLLNLFDEEYKDEKKRPTILGDTKVEWFNRAFVKMDLLILMGAIVEEKYLQIFRDLGRKVIYYKMGNDYCIMMERVLFDKEGANQEFTSKLDEIWYVPQQHEQNYGYYTTLYRTPAIRVPFVWHPKFLEKELDILKKEGNYKPYDVNKTKKVIGIFEPNLNTVKFCLIPILITEESYRTKTGRKYIDNLKVTNVIPLINNNKTFKSMMKTLDLFKDKKLFVEHRYRISWIMNAHTDIAVAHQSGNPLNYIYLDCIHMGYPILHNASLCKNLGYYYEGSDTVAASKVLNHILKNHDDNHSQYIKRNKKEMFKYRADNKNLIKAYDDLIMGIYSNDNKRKIYDNNTNLFKK